MRSLLIVAILGLSVTLTTAVEFPHPSTVIAAAPYTKNEVRFWGAPVYASTVNGHSIGSADISKNIGYRMTLALSWRDFLPLVDFIPGANFASGIGKRVAEIFVDNLPEDQPKTFRAAETATRQAASDRQTLRDTLDGLDTLNEDVDSILENLEDFDRRLNDIEIINQDNKERIRVLIGQVQMSDQRLATLQEDLDTIAKAALLALGVNTFLLCIVLALVWHLNRKIDKGFKVVVGLLRELIRIFRHKPRPDPPNPPPDPSPKPDESDEFSVSFHAPREIAEGALLGGRYTLEHKLRRDTYGVTYLAGDASTGRRVAIRQFLPDQCEARWSTNPTNYRQAVQYFKNDARILAALDSEFVVSINDVFDHSNTACMVMPLLVESTLAARLTDEGPLPAKLACQILKDLMEGLESLHAKQLVHGNISPTSVVLTKRGEATLPVLIDFGVIRSDENDAREEPGPSADISALGATMYEAATGHPPDPASGATSPRAANALVSDWFDLAIREALSGAAGPQSVMEWRERLLPSPPPPPPPPPWPLLAGVGAAVAILLTIFWLVPQRDRIGTGEEITVIPPTEEQGEWELIKATTEPQRVANFLDEWPDGQFSEDARELLSSLLMTREWEFIKATTEPQRVANFLDEWPDGQFSEDARELLSSLLMTREWEFIKATTEPQRVANFLDEWPDGQFSEDARELLSSLLMTREWESLRATTEPRRVANFLDEWPDGQFVEDARELLSSLLTRAGRRFRDCPGCPGLVVAPPGTFRMGSPDQEQDRNEDEGPQRTVRIDRPLAIGMHEVTWGEWRLCMTDRIGDKGCSSLPFEDEVVPNEYPVTRVSWEDANGYADWLSAKTGVTYRLLSEAEWEYAARAGTETPWYWTNRGVQCHYANGNDRANCLQSHHDCPNAGAPRDCYDGIAPVGRYRANAFGLHDMLGNVWEWTADCWYNYDALPDGDVELPLNGRSPVEDPDCTRRVVRGGAWHNPPRNLRAADRLRLSPGDRPRKRLA